MSKIETFSRNARCPFFQSAGKKSVRCESAVRQAYNVTVFFTKSEADDFVRRACCQNFKSCPYYRALMTTKYRD